MTDNQPPPADLGDAGRQLWHAILDELELDGGEFRLLLEACRCADELDRLAAALAEAPPTVLGSQGQPRPQPLLDEIRAHRMVLARLLGQIHDLDDDGRTVERRPRRVRRGG